MIWVNLFARLAGLALIALGGYAYYWSVSYGMAHGERCVAAPSPVVLHVPAADVAYARRQRWPRELYRGDPLRWSYVSLDRSPAGRRVRERSRRFCPERRFRLEAER